VHHAISVPAFPRQKSPLRPGGRHGGKSAILPGSHRTSARHSVRGWAMKAGHLNHVPRGPGSWGWSHSSLRLCAFTDRSAPPPCPNQPRLEFPPGRCRCARGVEIARTDRNQRRAPRSVAAPRFSGARRAQPETTPNGNTDAHTEEVAARLQAVEQQGVWRPDNVALRMGPPDRGPVCGAAGGVGGCSGVVSCCWWPSSCGT